MSITTFFSIAQIICLAAFAPASVFAYEPLRKASNNPEAVLRNDGVKIDKQHVIAALHSNQIEIRRAAADLLVKRWPTVASRPIGQSLSIERDGFTRVWMATDLAKINDLKGRSTLVSECFNQKERGSIRMYAATALSREFNDDSCAEVVVKFMQAPGDPRDDGAKAQALDLAPVLMTRSSHNQAEAIFHSLTDSLQDPIPFVRITASVTLERIGDARAVAFLRDAAAKETNDACLKVINTSIKSLEHGRKIQ